VLLGVAYKPNVGDVRESPALDLIHLLRERRANVVYHDPYVPSLRIDGATMNSITLDPEALLQADCVVIATDHHSYNWTWILNHSRLVVDTRNATRGTLPSAGRVVKL
jgi:UDP-N-acetyl-D-glucosamine dehydrogenase